MLTVMAWVPVFTYIYLQKGLALMYVERRLRNKIAMPKYINHCFYYVLLILDGRIVGTSSVIKTLNANDKLHTTVSHERL